MERDRSTEPSDPGTIAPRRRGRRPLVVLTVMAVLATLGVGGWWWLRRDTSRAVTVDEAVERAGDDAGGAGAGDPSAHDVPARGVYPYEGSGTVSLSIPPLEQGQGPTMPGTLTYGEPGCWLLRIDYSTHQWQTFHHCWVGGDLVERGGETWQRWMIGPTAVTNTTTSSCEQAVVLPSAREPGQEWETRCTATNDAVEGETVSTGAYRFVGEQEIDVGGTSVRAAHFVWEQAMTGAQEGEVRTELWFAVATGLLLRSERTGDVSTDSPVGRTSYAQTTSLHLTSLDPVPIS